MEILGVDFIFHKLEIKSQWPRTTVWSWRLRVQTCATTLGPQGIYRASSGPVGIIPAQRVGIPSVIKKN